MYKAVGRKIDLLYVQQTWHDNLVCALTLASACWPSGYEIPLSCKVIVMVEICIGLGGNPLLQRNAREVYSFSLVGWTIPCGFKVTVFHSFFKKDAWMWLG